MAGQIAAEQRENELRAAAGLPPLPPGQYTAGGANSGSTLQSPAGAADEESPDQAVGGRPIVSELDDELE